MKMFKIIKIQVYKLLKKKREILKLWENCANEKIKRYLRELQMKILMK